jgi:hypothetical protein
MAHSKYSPSSAHRYIACPGAVVLEQDYPNETSPYAEEGTLAHELAERILRCETLSDSDFDDETYPDMRDYVQQYVDQVLAAKAQLEGQGFDVQMYVEQKVDFSAIAGVEGQAGTADVVLLATDNESAVIEVHDLKYGLGVLVEAQDNPQLLTYASGVTYALRDFIDDFLEADIERVSVYIHQVRRDSLSMASYTLEEIDAFVGELSQAIQKAERQTKDNLELNPGEKQCRFCKARLDCPARTKLVFDNLVGDFENYEELEVKLVEAKQNLYELTDERVGEILHILPIIEDWCKDLRAKAYSTFEAGGDIPGWKIVEGRAGARKWVDDKEAESLLFEALEDAAYERKVLSPAKAEKLLKDNIETWSFMQKHIRQDATKPVLVTDDNPKPAITFGNPADDFENLEE